MGRDVGVDSGSICRGNGSGRGKSMQSILSAVFSKLVHRASDSPLLDISRGWAPAMGLVLVLTILWGGTGCDSLSFTPEKPGELASPKATARLSAPAAPAASTEASKGSRTGAPVPVKRSAPAARRIELILSQPPNIDRLFLEQFLRRDSGVKKCAFRSIKPEKSEPMSPAQIAQVIRSAANRGAGAIVVEPIDAPEVRQALHEAESKGVAIVSLDRSIPSSSPGKPYPLLTFKSFTEPGKKLIDAAIEEARMLGFPADGTILLIRNSLKDEYSDRRYNSLVGALKGAGRKFEELTIQPDDTSKAAVEAFLRAHPNTIIMLYDEDYGLTAAHDARRKWVESGHREVVLAGYTACDIRLDLLVKGRSAAIADRNVEGYAREALRLALDQIEGKAVPDVLEVEVPFARNRRIFYPVVDEPKNDGQAPSMPTAVP
jgi:ABC-type sugar transport system substrate-binding protein